MIGLFKSHYSIGKSILTLDDPKKVTDGGADSIFKIAIDNNLTTITLVEDSLIGFFEAFRRSRELGLNLVFGLRISMRNSSLPDDESSEHKTIIFAKNGDGCRLLNKIYSKAFCDFSGFLDYNSLKQLWSEDNLKLCVPFYDSFLATNNFSFSNACPDFSFCNPFFFIEENEVSYDHLLKQKVIDFASKSNFQTFKAKSIYYKNRKDAEAFQTYKIICNRSNGKERSLTRPELSHFCSNQFCFQAWKEQNAQV